MKQFRTPYLFRCIFHRRVWGFSLQSNTVYLTFDDGPTPECTRWILDVLAEHNVKATFFCVGANAQKYPELMEAMVSEGHQIGNHTMRHERGTATPKDQYVKSIEEAAEHIDSPLFRPPYGRIPMTFTKDLRKKYHIIMWSWLSYDYDKSVPVNDVLQQAKRIKSGDILVVHDNTKSFERLQQILPKLIETVHEKGLKFDVISA